MSTDKRKERLEQLKKNNKLVGRTKRKPCSKCGCKNYLIFFVENVNSNGIYCSKCGTWLKFENVAKKKKTTKTKKPKKDYAKYIEYLKSCKWKRIRLMVAKRDNYICQRCGADVHNYFEIHHRNYKTIFHEEDDLGCLSCLCKDCHDTITRKQKKGRKKKNLHQLNNNCIENL